MKHLKLYLGSSDVDAAIRQTLEDKISNKPDVDLDCESIHDNPIAAIRLGITRLPALTLDDELIAQGTPENWVTPLLDRLLTCNDADG